jgi:hypothetical protein
MPILVSKYEEPLVPYSDLISINQPNMTSKGNDFAGTLSNEFVLPTNKTVGAYRVIGEDGQCSHLCPILTLKSTCILQPIDHASI